MEQNNSIIIDKSPSGGLRKPACEPSNGLFFDILYTTDTYKAHLLNSKQSVHTQNIFFLKLVLPNART